MKRRAAVWAFAIATIAVSATSLAQTAADKAAAEALYNDAKKLIADKRYGEACPKLEESMRLDPGIGIMLHLASCFEKTAKVASAWALFREAQQLATKENDKRADVARQRADALEPLLHKLTIVVPSSSDVAGLEVKRDGSLVGRGQWGTSVPVDPGEHTIAASAPGKSSWQSKVTTPDKKGETSVSVPALADAPVAVVAPSASSTSATPAPTTSSSAAPTASTSETSPFVADAGAQSQSSDGRKITALVIAGVGVVGLGVGTYFGLHTKSQLDESNAPGNCKASTNHCTATGAGLRSDAQTSGNISTVAFGLGLVAVAGGALLWFTAPKADATHAGTRRTTIEPSVGASGGGVVVRGSF